MTTTHANPHGLTPRQIGDLALADGTCGICGRVAQSPHRRIVDGVIVEGCVARLHWAHLVKPSGSAAFHASYHRSLGQPPAAPKSAR